MSDWKTLIGNQILEHAPFLVGATGGGVNTTRIVEAVLIAGATAMLTSAITTDKVAARLEERIVAVQARLAAEEQRRRNDFYRRCRSMEAMVKGFERTAAVYWGDPRYQERATVAREQFGIECW